LRRATFSPSQFLNDFLFFAKTIDRRNRPRLSGSLQSQQSLSFPRRREPIFSLSSLRLICISSQLLANLSATGLASESWKLTASSENVLANSTSSLAATS
jgi:hypothetical protein